MEECLKAASIRAGLQADVLPLALEYQRTLTAKKASFGISLNYSCVICLHLAAANLGKNINLKWMVRIAGAKSKPHYLQTYQNAENVLQIGQRTGETLRLRQQLLPKPLPVSGIQRLSKTYTIQRNPKHMPNSKPIQPKLQPPVPLLQRPTHPLVAQHLIRPRVVGLQSLGNKTLTIKDGQLNVHGSDHDMTRSRYFKQAVRHRPVFRWTSDPVEPTKGREDTVHFSSFKLDNMSYSTGDFVLVRNTDSPDFAEVRIQ